MNPLMNSVGSNAEGKLNCINAVVITQIRTVILIQSVSGLRFLLFGKNGVFAALLPPAASKENPARFVFLVGFLPLRAFTGFLWSSQSLKEYKSLNYKGKR